MVAQELRNHRPWGDLGGIIQASRLDALDALDALPGKWTDVSWQWNLQQAWPKASQKLQKTLHRSWKFNMELVESQQHFTKHHNFEFGVSGGVDQRCRSKMCQVSIKQPHFRGVQVGRGPGSDQR